MKVFFSSEPVALLKAIAVLRMIIGALCLYHGQEIFNRELMQSYLAWDVFQGPMGEIKVYLGKGAEFLAGISLLFGLFTRMGALLVVGTLSFVTFFVGQGRFWYEDQHPFMFVLFGVLFLFTGPGAWSLDARLFDKR